MRGQRTPSGLRMAATVLLTVMAATTPVRAEKLSEAQAREVFNKIVPSDDQLTYELIPWRPSLKDAVLEAQARDMPLMIWTMRGHPLGGT